MAAMLRAIFLVVTVLLVGCVSNGGNRPVNKNNAVQSYLELSRGYLQQGYAERAINPVNRALELDPDSAEVYGTLGLIYQVQGENLLADQSFKKALSLKSDAADIRNNYGAFLFGEGRLNEAYRQFAVAADNVKYSSRSRAYENMGLVSLNLGRLSQAREHFQKALKLNGNLARARLELATILEEQGKSREAWGHYQIFTRLAGQNEQSLKLGIKLAKANGDNSAAASYTLQLERLYPSSTR
ncbi:type IV pilus biogenesis/stability protein PilW [Endozoicomonas sp. OPT23]|uniref:type IV pilus biogenesis/stability protein PilW n=1 Tax=Endozoicomonas sp. OPT23 TaxID=2072845 RepID=UPI00129BB25A|nr:type IV pilus biogenesis/stability protein PilW [Endozoicomonas sp. OPT23]MRI35069.1 type IV pilus biogenesis/stability protein PilW [Endozoicomonas sp. OPT23]